ncbi:polysaccharide deacetylase family protein [Natronomonas salina]|uniref:polysaccharide deacetylase family protein n=1 Tax=Natronomonas salina TaxID=1710540 RepID=UPI0015B51FA3|nr:polysaccharide deacetylase family protein [Natronomonas salina]QLD88767.1 polysaccharide deacetylase family protein [Natronomonas salina]
MRDRTEEKCQLDWPDEKRVYLTLDFECDYGTALSTNHFNTVEHSDQLAELLEERGTPMSCFLQTEILETCPKTITPFRDATVPVDFHAHSHTHPNREDADVETEVEESVHRIRENFETDPLGFRFPDGAVGSQDYEILADHDVAFSSSLFPSWRPGRFNNFRGSRNPQSISNRDIIEIPFTVYSDFLRIPVALSYLKLFGAAFERLVRSNPPDIIIFDFHMHDLVVPKTFEQLPLPYRAVYSRRKHDGFELLDRFICDLQDKGYEFGLIADLYREVQKDA